jgi:hypothetical protein
MQDASEAEVALRVRSSPLLMFDSAVAGSDLEMVEALLIELQPGTYRVSSGEFNPVTLHDQAYNTDRHIATGNPYRKLVTDLMGRGVQVELCGATAKAHGWGNADLLPGMM